MKCEGNKITLNLLGILLSLFLVVGTKRRNILVNVFPTLYAAFFFTTLSNTAFSEVTAEQMAVYEQLLDFSSLVKQGSVAPIWRNDGSRFVYLSAKDNEQRYVELDPSSGKVTPFFNELKLHSALSRVLDTKTVNRNLPLKQFSFFDSDKVIRFEIDGRQIELTLKDYSVNVLSAEANARIDRRQARATTTNFPSTAPPHNYEIPSPAGDRLLAIKDHNLWLRNIIDDRTRALTWDGTSRYSWSADVTWSEDGNFLAAFKVDARKVHHMPVVHWLKRQEEVSYHLYPQAGGILPQRELHFIDVLSGSRVPVVMGNDATYIRQLGWHPNKDEFMFFCLSREGKRVELRAAHKKTGKVRVLWEDENQETFVVDHMQFWTGLLFKMLDDGRFIVSSQRSGWNHLYLYGPHKGKYRLVKQLTKGAFPVQSIVGVDEVNGTVFFMASPDKRRIYDQHFMRVELSGKGLIQLTNEIGYHNITLSPSKKYFLDTHSTVARPQVTELRRTESGQRVTELSRMKISKLTRIGWQAPEEFVAKAADGKTDLHGIIRKPWNFDPHKKYPVIEYIYGGPQITVVPRTFVPTSFSSAMNFCNALTQLGFIVVSLDARGTPGRSKDFQDVVYGNLGRHEVADHAAVLREIADTRSYMDMERVGIVGGSYGGYFTTRALLQAPSLYKVGVAAAPAVHLDNVLAGTVEAYMGGRPQDTHRLYDYADNRRLLDRLEGKLLIMQPTSDINVPFGQSMQLVDALIQVNKPHDLVIVPEANHHNKYRDSTEPHVFWRNTVRDYFIEHL